MQQVVILYKADAKSLRQGNQWCMDKTSSSTSKHLSTRFSSFLLKSTCLSHLWADSGCPVGGRKILQESCSPIIIAARPRCGKEQRRSNSAALVSNPFALKNFRRQVINPPTFAFPTVLGNLSPKQTATHPILQPTHATRTA